MKNTGLLKRINTIEIGELSALLGIGPRQIQRLARVGALPRPEKRGHYDLQECIAGYAAYQRSKIRSLRGKRPKGKKRSWFPESKQTTHDTDIVFDPDALNKEIRAMISGFNKKETRGKK